MMAVMREPELIAAAQGRDMSARDSAFRELAQAVTPKLLAMCTNMLGSADDAADAVQDALLRAHEGLATFEGTSKFSTWVFRIAIREAIHRRSLKRPHEELTVQNGGAAESPEALLESRDALRRTQAAMLTLSAEHRTVVSLFAAEGLRHGEIAEILGVPEGTVWRRLHEARKALRAAMQKRAAEWPQPA